MGRFLLRLPGLRARAFSFRAAMPQPSLPLSQILRWAENRECTDAVLLIRTAAGELKVATTSCIAGISEQRLTDGLEAVTRHKKPSDPERP